MNNFKFNYNLNNIYIKIMVKSINGSKYKTKRRRNKNRGGMRRALTTNMITTFSNPHLDEFQSDCCPCVFLPASPTGARISR